MNMHKGARLTPYSRALLVQHTTSAIAPHAVGQDQQARTTVGVMQADQIILLRQPPTACTPSSNQRQREYLDLFIHRPLPLGVTALAQAHVSRLRHQIALTVLRDTAASLHLPPTSACSRERHRFGRPAA